MTMTLNNQAIQDVTAMCTCEVPHLGPLDGDCQRFTCQTCELVIGYFNKATITTNLMEEIQWEK